MHEKRLATYGTLAPGRVNNHELSELNGQWLTGYVRGNLLEDGWGAELGYPGLALDPSGQKIEVYVFQSDDLPEHWDRLDAFEGEGYTRVPVTVHTLDGDLEASIYTLAR